MKKLLFFVVFLLFASIASASIVPVDSPKDLYNLGDSLRLSYTLSREQGLGALFRVNLICNSYTLSYFTTPVSLTPNEKLLIQVPEIRFSEQMLGSCAVRLFFESFKGEVMENRSSANFTVSDKLGVKATVNKRELLPGDELAVEGEVVASYGAYNGAVVVSFGESRDFVSSDASRFTHTIAISRAAKARNYSVNVFVNDSFGNSGEQGFSVKVVQVPTTFSLELNSASFIPNATLRMVSTLLDQAGDAITADADLKVFDPEMKVIYSGTSAASEVVTLAFEQFAKPGNYNVEAFSSGLKDKKSFKMEEYEKLDITYSEKFVRIRNIGNVPYNKNVELRFVREGKEYTFIRGLSLNPGETAEINLFAEVPAGTYNIAVSPENQPSIVFEGITTADERPFSKKLTGSLVSPFSPNKMSFILAPIVMVVLIALVAFYFKNRSHFRNKDLLIQKRQFNEALERTAATKPATTPALKENILAVRHERMSQKESEAAARKAVEDLRNRPDIKKFVQQQLKGR